MGEGVDLIQRGALLRYRPWQGQLGETSRRGELLFVAGQAALFTAMAFLEAWPAARLLCSLAFLGSWGLVVKSRAWPIARVSLQMLFRRKLFWGIYTLSVLVFLLFFFGQYLMSWAVTQIGEQEVRVGGMGRANPKFLVEFFRDQLKLNGSSETFRNFFWYEGYTVMVALALAGSIIVGNDIRFGSLAFYLARPISRWDYLLGKGIAVAVFVNLLTTVPALLLFVQYGMLEDWEYFLTHSRLLVGILGYGLILTLCLTTVLLATAVWVRRTVPLIMTWTTLFFFTRQLSEALVNALQFDPRWRLIDLWNCTLYLGQLCLEVKPELIRPSPQPAWQEAALVLGGVSLLCLSYLIWRVRGVEIVT